MRRLQRAACESLVRNRRRYFYVWWAPAAEFQVMFNDRRRLSDGCTRAAVGDTCMCALAKTRGKNATNPSRTATTIAASDNASCS